jgi:hypothetical protein
LLLPKGLVILKLRLKLRLLVLRQGTHRARQLNSPRCSCQQTKQLARLRCSQVKVADATEALDCLHWLVRKSFLDLLPDMLQITMQGETFFGNLLRSLVALRIECETQIDLRRAEPAPARPIRAIH